MDQRGRQAVQGLFHRQVRLLSARDVLQACYAPAEPTRDQAHLQRYYRGLAHHPDVDAPVAQALVCYDLARSGDELAQRMFEFGPMAHLVHTLPSQANQIDRLTAGVPYLEKLWVACHKAIVTLDPRIPKDGPVAMSTWDDDSSVSDLGVDALAAMAVSQAEDLALARWHAYDEAVEAFFGAEPGLPVYAAGAGFHLFMHSDVLRLERCLRALKPLRLHLAPARGFYGLVSLFYGTHIRSRGAFGRINRKKQRLLRRGLEDFCADFAVSAQLAGLLQSDLAEGDAWPKMLDVVQDYVAWMGAQAPGVSVTPARYPAVERLVARHAQQRAEGSERRQGARR